MCGVWPLGLGLRWETHPGLFCLPARVGGVGGGVVLAWGTAACGCLVGAAACGRGPCGVCVGGVLVLWLPVWWLGGWGWHAVGFWDDTPSWAAGVDDCVLGMVVGLWWSGCCVVGLAAACACSPVGVGCGWWCGRVGCELYSGREHLTDSLCVGFVVVVFVFGLLCCFVFLSVRWMPWHQGPMKDVVACDKPRGAGWRAVIRGFPNGGTRHELCRVTCV